MRFLIDECLSPALVRVAREAGHEAYHVAHRGWSGQKDWQLFRTMCVEHFVLVTNNRHDWVGIVGRIELHPGLIVIVENVPREEEVVFFRRALSHIDTTRTDMVNQVIEVDERGHTRRYALPPIG